jgi:CDP-diacylglycerol---glycerol-3-phosphate 3-phosphatidyltransferase
MAPSRLNLPNLITIARIAACPAIFYMALAEGLGIQFAAFVLFVVAGLSDLWDGYLARKYEMITDMGKLLDPLADKLLLVATLVPIYMISHRTGEFWPLPYWGAFPTWVMVVIFGREILITIFRQWAARRDVVIAAGRSGKNKALLQNLFAGGALFWYPLQAASRDGSWDMLAWTLYEPLHAAWIGITLLASIVLTVYSMFDYFWSYRTLIGVGR